MHMDEYGVWVSIRNKNYPISKEHAEIISEAILNDLTQEQLSDFSTWRYNLFYNGVDLGELLSYNVKGQRRVSTHLKSQIWLVEFSKDTRAKIAKELEIIEKSIQQKLGG